MKKILFISHNNGKVADLKSMLEPLGYEVISANDLELPDIPETGETFEENALIKVRVGHEATGLPCIADDSGLCVDALSGKPGVYTARYSEDRPQGTPYTSKLLGELEAMDNSSRGAQFECRIAYIDASGAEHIFAGSVEGTLADVDRGNDGFAYDFVFIPKGESHTFAEMGKAKKNTFSHRGNAMRKFLEHLKWAT